MEDVMRKILGLAFLFCIGVVASVSAQDVAVNRQNRTVDVTVTAKVSKFADLADVRFSCNTKSPVHEQAYQQNAEKANKITQALIGAGIPKIDIVTSSMYTEQEELTTAQKKENPNRAAQFEASQSWTVRVAAADAQRVIDVAVHAGANDVDNVTWMLSNPDVAESQARMDALKKAHSTAADLAADLGGKLGEPIFVSNQLIKTTLLARQSSIANVIDADERQVSVSPKPGEALQLFPEKIETEATVRVVFALD
jgi:uncharacterized protein YggE